MKMLKLSPILVPVVLLATLILTSCSTTRLPSVKGKITSETEVKMNDLYWKAYYNCTGRRLMIFTTSMENCGHRIHTINVNRRGKFKLPSAFFLTSLSEPRPDCEYDLYHKNQENQLFSASSFPDKKPIDVLFTIVKKNITVKLDTTVINEIINILEKHYKYVNLSKLSLKLNYEIGPRFYNKEMNFHVEELLQKDSVIFSEYIAIPHEDRHSNSNDFFQEKFTLEIYEVDKGRGDQTLLKLSESRDFKPENYNKNITFSLKDKEQVKYLINNIQNSFFASAVQKENIEEVRNLLKKGADPNKKAGDNIPVLIEATKDRNYDIVKMLLDAGADVNSSYENKSVLGYAIIATIPQTYSCLYKEINGVAKYLAEIKKIEKIIEILLKNGAKVEKDSSDIPNLIKAVYLNDYKLVKKLVEQGADVNSRYDTYKVEISVLEQALTTPKILPELYSKGKRSEKYLAEIKKNDKIIKFLIKHGAKINENSRILWKSLLIHAFGRIDFLAQNGGIDISNLLKYKERYYRYIKENSYLHMATDRNSETAIPIIKYLVNKGMDVDLRNKKGQTPLLFALTNKNIYKSNRHLKNGYGKNTNEIIKFLADNGADVKAKTKENQTALHVLLHRYGDCLYINRAVPEDIDSSDINAKDNLLQLVNFIIDTGVDIHAVDDDGFTAFHYCAREGHLNVAELLLNKGVDINYPVQPTGLDTTGNKTYDLMHNNYSPLFITAGEADMNDLENIRMFEFLLKCGADIHYKPEDGKTLDDIISNNREETIIVLNNILKKYCAD